MKRHLICLFVLSSMIIFFSSASQAIDIAMVGADPRPNATGEIPAYTGNKGLTCYADYKPGDFVPNPCGNI